MDIGISARIAEQTFESLKNDPSGKIIMANSSGVYLQFEERTVFLCDDKWGIVPNGILSADFEKTVKRLRPEEGDPVIFKYDKIIFPNGAVKLITFEEPAGGCGETPRTEDIARASRELTALKKDGGISMLAGPLISGEDSCGVININPYCAKAYPLLARLMKGLSDNSADEVKYCVGELLGLGVGLTPSADDVFTGMLYVFVNTGANLPSSAEIFKKSVWDLCDTHTNRISGSYLKAVINGAYFERMEQVWRGLCGIEAPDITRLTGIGSNSGAEMLLGMLAAFRICGCNVSR